jgi:hypothetical protein
MEDASQGRRAERRPTRRAFLATAAGAAFLAACGDRDGKPTAKKGGPPPGKVGPGGRPLKTTKRVHPKAQASASRSRGPLPPDLQAYLERKQAEGALVLASRTRVLHHPVVCRKHLPTSKAAPNARRKPVPERPAVHRRYADGILYALLQAETDRAASAGLALSAALAWPVSVRLTDLAIARLRDSAGAEIDVEAVARSFVAASGGRASADEVRPRAEAGLALLRTRLDGRARGRGGPAMDGGR